MTMARIRCMLPAQHDERVVGGSVADLVAAVGAEERLTITGPAEPAAAVGGIVPQRRKRAGVQRYQPRPAALAGADGEHATGQVDVAAGQGQCLADPQPRACDQPEQRGIAVRPQPTGRRQAGSGLQQVFDLAVGIYVRRFTVPCRAEQSRRGHFGSAVGRSQVAKQGFVSSSASGVASCPQMCSESPADAHGAAMIRVNCRTGEVR